MKLWRKIIRRTPAYLSLLCILAVLTRLTVKDRWPGPSLLYYALPLAVVTILLFITSLLWLLQKQRWPALGCLVAALMCGLWWYQTCYIRNDASPDPSCFRTAFWNVGHGFGGWSNIDRQIERIDADVIGLCEGNRRGRHQGDWPRQHPDYHVATAPAGLVVLTRGTIIEKHFFDLGWRVKCWHLKIDLKGRRFNMMLADLNSRPFYTRQEHFRRLNAVLDTLPERPALLMGDFNTPYDSVYFDSIRRRLRNAFVSAGTGHHATWPIPLPVLALDQIWASTAVQIHQCRLGWTWRSDHRPVIAELEIP